VPADFTADGNPTRHYGDDEHLGHHRARPDEGDLHQLGAGHGPKVNPVAAVLMAVPLYLWNFAPHPFKPPHGASGVGAMVMLVLDIAMWFFLLVLELIGAAIKPFALMIRLFANMIAG